MSNRSEEALELCFDYGRCNAMGDIAMTDGQEQAHAHWVNESHHMNMYLIDYFAEVFEWDENNELSLVGKYKSAYERGYQSIVTA